MMRGGPR
jgi:hypothetical protein